MRSPILLVLMGIMRSGYATGTSGMPSVGSIFMVSKTISSGHLAVSFVNATSGKTVSTQGAQLPPNDFRYPDCKKPVWTVATGTRGQSNAMFGMNATAYFLAEEKCADKTQRVAILAVFNPQPPFPPPPPPSPSTICTCCGGTRTKGCPPPSPPCPCPPPMPPSPPPPPTPTRVMQSIKATGGSVDMQTWNMVWDGVCNFVVLQPVESTAANISFTTWNTLMVSEYDGAVRPQSPYFSQPTLPDDGTTVKLPGLGGMLYDGKSEGWPKMGNCGECTMYGAEATFKRGAPCPLAPAPCPPPASVMTDRRIVGKNFHSGLAATSAPDPFSTQTMSADVSTGYPAGVAKHGFVGLGSCCADAELCGAACATAPGALALVGYDGTNSAPYLLTVVPRDAQGAPTMIWWDSVRLGVLIEVDPPFGDPKTQTTYARVMVTSEQEAGHFMLVSFVLTAPSAAGGGKLSAVLNTTVASECPGKCSDVLFWQHNRFASGQEGWTNLTQQHAKVVM